MNFDHRQEHVDEEMLILQANIDDMNPELCPYIGEQLLAHGANDIYWIPIIMKKGRPGLMLNVYVHEDKREAMERIIFTETTTLGIRNFRAACHRLGRETVQVSTIWGDIRIKVGYLNEKPVQIAPEFTDCERAAKEHRVPLKLIYEEAKRQFEKKR